MKFFGKKKPFLDRAAEGQGVEEVKRQIELGDKNRSFKKIKDLKSENKKRRKTPIRPWSKIDRILIFILIILTAGTSSYLALKSRDFKLPGLGKPDIDDLNPFNSEVVIEANSESKEKAEKIINDFKNQTIELSGSYALFVVDLERQYSFGVDQDEEFVAASLIKLPVMAGMYMEEEDGNIDLDDKYFLKSEDKVAGAGSLYYKQVGYETTYRNLIRLMGQQSDNTAFNICRKYLGDAKVNEVAQSIGMVNTDIGSNATAPRDVGIFFQKLYDEELINEKNTQELIDFMINTSYESWLAEGIPAGVKFSHKYGREVHVVNDAGIVFTEDPYVVVVMSKGVVDREADKIFPILSQNIFVTFTNFE